MHILLRPTNLHHLTEADVDGTFETCPQLFYQIFTIHVTKYSQTFPMEHALLPNKRQSTYNCMFMMMREAALDHGLDFTHSSVLSNFEQALINALIELSNR